MLPQQLCLSCLLCNVPAQLFLAARVLATLFRSLGFLSAFLIRRCPLQRTCWLGLLGRSPRYSPCICLLSMFGRQLCLSSGSEVSGQSAVQHLRPASAICVAAERALRHCSNCRGLHSSSWQPAGKSGQRRRGSGPALEQQDDTIALPLCELRRRTCYRIPRLHATPLRRMALCMINDHI